MYFLFNLSEIVLISSVACPSSGILHLNQDALMEMDFLHGAQVLTHLPEDMSSDQLFKSIQMVSTTIGKRTFTQIVDKYVFPTSSQCS